MNRKKLNILFIIHSANLVGGAFTGLHQFLKEIPRDRYNRYLVFPNSPSLDSIVILKKVSEDITVVPMGGFWVKSNRSPFRRFASDLRMSVRSFFHVISLLKLINLIREWEIDLVYSNGVMVMDGAIAAKISRIPHLWHVKERVGKNGNTQFYLPDKLAVFFIESLSSEIVTMSNFIAQPLKRFGKKKIKVVYDGVDVSEFETDVDQLEYRKSLGIKNDEHLVGMVASLGAEWKRHELFIESAYQIKSCMPKTKFIHFGAIPSEDSNRREYYHSLCKLIEKYKLEEDFIWGGVVEDISTMMGSLDILIHPSEREPFGRIALEAMAARCPVVGPNSGGIAESIVPEKTGLLVNGLNPTDFAQATCRLLSDPILCQRIGNEGHNHVSREFSVDKHVNQITNIFENMIAREGMNLDRQTQ